MIEIDENEMKGVALLHIHRPGTDIVLAILLN
jgi:hypothetical protein